jgi:hypothetical protein
MAAERSRDGLEVERIVRGIGSIGTEPPIYPTEIDLIATPTKLNAPFPDFTAPEIDLIAAEITSMASVTEN